MAESNSNQNENQIDQQEQLTSDISLVDPNKAEDSPEKKRETTRSEIAKLYVIAFFITIGVTFLIGLISCFEAKDYKDMLITVSGILSGPLGFIIGYYFKSATSKE